MVLDWTNEHGLNRHQSGKSPGGPGVAMRPGDPVTLTLIEAGHEDRVRETRAAHRAATDAIYKARMEAYWDGR
jgi:hypothetical protein